MTTGEANPNGLPEIADALRRAYRDTDATRVGLSNTLDIPGLPRDVRDDLTARLNTLTDLRMSAGALVQVIYGVMTGPNNEYLAATRRESASAGMAVVRALHTYTNRDPKDGG